MDQFLEVRFDIDRLEQLSGSPAYGPQAWRVFWTAVDASRLSAARLRDGDTAKTLSHQENVFCIEVRTSPAAVQEAKQMLARSLTFREVAADPPLLDADVPNPDPLVEAGHVVDGRVVGHGWAVEQALGQRNAEPTESTGARPGENTAAPVRPRTGLIIGVLAAALLVIVAGVAIPVLLSRAEPPPRSPSASRIAATTSGHLVHYTSLKVGECISGPELRSTTGTWPDLLQVQPCAQQHDAEVFFVADFGEATQPYPGDDAVDREWTTSCNRAFRAYVGVEYRYSVLVYRGWTPTRESWEHGDRNAGCFAYDADDRLSTTVKDLRR